MSAILKIPLNGGYVSTGADARSADDLESGELVSMEGAFYRKNDRGMAWKMPGRSEFGSAGSTAVKGIAICQFDEGGTDKLVASIGTTLVAATPGATGTFASLVTGLNSSATRLTACHQDDRWYLGNGYDKNITLRPDGTTRDTGMSSPQTKLTYSFSSSAGGGAYPTANSGAFSNPTFAYDAAGIATYASGTRSTAGATTHTYLTWGASTVPNRSLTWRWSLAGLPISGDAGSFEGGGSIGTGGSLDSGYNVTITFEKSLDITAATPAWTTIYTTTRSSATSGSIATSVSIDNAVNSNVVGFRATLTYNSGTTLATLRLINVAINYDSAVVAFNTTGSMYYAYTEYNSQDDIEGPPSELTEVVAFTSKNLVTLTRGTTINSAATHWIVYRSVPGAAGTIDSMGKLAEVPIAESAYYDSFDQDGSAFMDPTIQLVPTIPAMTIGDLSIPRDSPPPAFINMISWNGSICGISRETGKTRTLRYSQAGRAESFPEFYVVSSFPLDEHDNLIGQMGIGETLVLLCEGAVLALDDLPRVVDGQFNAVSARQLKGHPGCVGEYAYTTYSVAGEPRGAWVSPFGVYITNGQTCACISTDLAWEREVNVPYLGTSVLRWDARNVILWFEFDLDGDGLNDHEMPFHMAEAHSKGESRPKLGQPTAKATSCMASALIDSTHYRFSGHPSDGSVYVEEVGTVDEATGDEVEMTVRSGQVGREMITLGIIKATLSHSDFGTGETGTFTATLYRDSSNSENSREQSIRLDGNRATTIGIGRAGDLVDVEVVYSGPGTGGFGDVSLEVEGHGRAGSAPRVTSNSATP